MTPARQTGIWLAVALGAALFLVLFQDILLPFLAGIAIAYFLDPLVDRLERRGVGRTAGAVLVLVGFAVASLGVLLLLVPVVNAQLGGLIANLPGYVETLERIVSRVMARLQSEFSPEDMEGLRRALTGHLAAAAGWAGEIVGRVLGSGLALVNLLGLLVVTPVVAFYLLRDWDRIVSAVDDLLPRRSAPVIRQQAARIDATLAGFVRGQATVCIVLGLGYGCLLMLAGLDFGFIVGIFSGLVSFVPYVGSILGGLISVGLAFDQFESALAGRAGRRDLRRRAGRRRQLPHPEAGGRPGRPASGLGDLRAVRRRLAARLRRHAGRPAGGRGDRGAGALRHRAIPGEPPLWLRRCPVTGNSSCISATARPWAPRISWSPTAMPKRCRGSTAGPTGRLRR